MYEGINEAYEAVLTFLKGIPLSDGTVKAYRDCYKNIARYCQREGISVFADKEAETLSNLHMTRYEKGEVSRQYATSMRKAAMMLADRTKGKELKWERMSFGQKPLSGYYEKELRDFEASLVGFLASGTVRQAVCNVRKFFFFLEENVISDLNELKVEDISKFIIASLPERRGSMDSLICYVRKFIVFLRVLGRTDIDEKLISNPAPRRTGVLPRFTDAEVDALLSAVDTTTEVGKRDYAIMRIAIGTGLRGEDIFALELTDIDWRKNEIYAIQEKTGGHIQLPLLPDVGNAIADYILNARPKSDSPVIFLRHRRPHVPFAKDGAGAKTIERHIKNAEVAREARDGKTFHAFRRTIGTRLVIAETPLPSVAQILGHKAIESSKRYIAMNDDMMRVCCMDISDFGTRKEGLA